MTITLIIGIPVGALAGYYGGWIDNVLMRIIDATLALPSLMVLILLGAILREANLPFVKSNNVLTIAAVLGLLAWPTTARLASAMRIIRSEILPNSLGPIIVESTLEIGYAIMEESGLSFLGFGIMPPTPTWGNMLNSAQEHLVEYPWLAIFPGLMIFLVIISINYIGDGLRDALDPYKVLAKFEP